MTVPVVDVLEVVEVEEDDREPATITFYLVDLGIEKMCKVQTVIDLGQRIGVCELAEFLAQYLDMREHGAEDETGDKWKGERDSGEIDLEYEHRVYDIKQHRYQAGQADVGDVEKDLSVKRNQFFHMRRVML